MVAFQRDHVNRATKRYLLKYVAGTERPETGRKPLQRPVYSTVTLLARLRG